MFVNFFIRRPIFASVCSVIIVLVGALAIPTLPIAQYPTLALPQVQVTSSYTGASAEAVESAVTLPLEQQINGVEGMKYISSTSTNDGVSQITVTFDPQRSVDIAAVDVQNRVQTASAALPNEVRQTGIAITKNSGSFVLAAALYPVNHAFDTQFVSNYADVYMRDGLKRIPGVADVQLFGERRFSMRVWLDPMRLASRGLTATDVVAALREQNVQVAAGQVGQPPSPQGQAFQVSIRAQGRLSEPAEFDDVILKRGDNGALVRLKDVGRAELGAQDYTQLTRFDGKEGIGLGITQLPGANALDVAAKVKSELKRMSRDFPPNLKYEIAFDTTLAVQQSIEEVLITLAEAIALVVLVILLFLQGWRATLIPALTIPVSLVGTFAFVKLLGFSINTLTLFGLTLATGLVVDDAIVVIENIARHLEHDAQLSPRQAALDGMAEVVGPVIAMSLTLVAVFVPVSFFPGSTGVIYQQFALTIAFSVALSTFNSLTLTPALSALLLRHNRGQKWIVYRWVDRGLEALTHGYTRLLGWVLRHRVVSLGAFGGFLAALAILYQHVPGAFVPEEDQGYFIINVQGPEGSSLEETGKTLAQVAQVLHKNKDVQHVFEVGGFSFGGNGSNRGLAFAPLETWDDRKGKGHTAAAIMDSLRADLSAIKGASVVAFPPPAIQGIGNLGGFQFELEDRSLQADLGTVESAAQTLVSTANQSPELQGVFTSFTANDPQLVVQVDRERAKSLGITLDDIFTTMQVSLGSEYVNDFDFSHRSYRVYAQAEAGFRRAPKDIGALYVRTAQGAMVPLESLVKVKRATTAQVITHYNLFRSAELNGDAAIGHSSGEALAKMEALTGKLSRNFSFEWSGISKEEQESGGQTGRIFILGVVFVFLVLAAQYESLSLPFVVILAVPFAVLGALFSQWLRGLSNDVFCQVGIVMLVGLASKNAILIVEFAKERREAGAAIVDAAIEGARTRLRPILMTSIAFLLGVVPLMVATGAGAVSRNSLGTAVFGGMLFSTTVNLFFTPLLFVLVESLRERSGGTVRAPAGHAPVVTEHESPAK